MTTMKTPKYVIGGYYGNSLDSVVKAVLRDMERHPELLAAFRCALALDVSYADAQIISLREEVAALKEHLRTKEDVAPKTT